MTLVNSSPPAPSSVQSQDLKRFQDVDSRAELQRSRSEVARVMATDQTVALALSDTSRDSESLESDRIKSHNKRVGMTDAVLKEQDREESSSFCVVEDSWFPVPHEQVVYQKRPSRAAAAAATVGMARQVKEEAGSLEMLISSALVLDDMDPEMHSNTKKRTARGSGAAVKRVRMASVNVTQDVSSMTKQGPSRGKKRRPASVYDLGRIEASPIITDIPPLPFTSTETQKSKSKAKPHSKHKTRVTEDMECEDDRTCEFCRKVANICALMHCHACRRVYHAQCFVLAFRPYVDASLPIETQIDNLLLEAAERRGSIFRCISCKAAFLDFYQSGGYVWDCQCPTCLHPQKLALYRRRKLVQMMNDMDLEKQRKKEQKQQKKNGNVCSSDKPLSLPSPSTNVTSSNRRTRKVTTSVHNPMISVEDVQLAAMTLDVNNDMKQSKAEDELKLVGDDLIHAVQVSRDETTGSWCFPVMCSRTASLRDSGVLKTGKCTWLAQTHLRIQCSCCTKVLNASEFVHHTDSRLIPRPSAASNESMHFLFVEHRDATQYTLLEPFLQALRSWSGRQNTSTSGETTGQKVSSGNEEPHVGGAGDIPAMTMGAPTNVQNHVARLQALALFKQPKLKSSKFEFLAQIVCLPSKYVMTMQNGTLADLVVRSKTPVPGDSFPRKTGWLPFNRTLPPARQLICSCCDESFTFDDFAGHAGISASEINKLKARQLLYVVERQDESALVPFYTFLSDLELITSQGMDSFLNELNLVPSGAFCPR